MFATDRDLVALEPKLFRDVAWVSQRLFEGTGDVSGSTLSIASGSFESAGVEAGHVVLIGGVPHEVVSRDSATALTVSRMRASVDGAVIAPDAGTGLLVSVYSFGPQMGIVHGQVLRMLGIEPSEVGAAVSEASITNPEALRLLEAFGALHLVFAAAAALEGEGSALRRRAESYRELFAHERGRVSVAVDLDGDGSADATRRLNAVRFVRG